MARKPEIRWQVVKDYYRGETNFTDTWPFLYGTKQEAEDAKTCLEAGQDRTWFDPSGECEEAGESAFLYVDQIDISGAYVALPAPRSLHPLTLSHTDS